MKEGKTKRKTREKGGGVYESAFFSRSNFWMWTHVRNAGYIPSRHLSFCNFWHLSLTLPCLQLAGLCCAGCQECIMHYLPIHHRIDMSTISYYALCKTFWYLCRHLWTNMESRTKHCPTKHRLHFILAPFCLLFVVAVILINICIYTYIYIYLYIYLNIYLYI